MKTVRTAVRLGTLALLVLTGEAMAQKPLFDCPGGGRLEPGPAAPAGRPYSQQRASDLIRQPDFATRHQALAGQEAPWVVELRGPSSGNRFYVRSGERVLVFDACKPRDCGDNKLYGAIENGGGYGLRIFERQQPRDLGNLSPGGWAAIGCARTQDEEISRQVDEKLQRQYGQ